MQWAVAGALRWAALSGLYLALVGQFPISEVVTGLLAGVSAAALSLLLRGTAERRFCLRAPWHWLVPRLSWLVLRDVNRVALALMKAAVVGQMGAITSQPFVQTGEMERRALAVLLASVAPNSYVLDS